MRRWDVEVNRVLSGQRGVIAAGQVLACGASRGAIETRVRSGLWTTVAPGVFRLSGAEGGWEQALWVAHLAAGPASTVSHESAAELHGLAAVRRGLVTLTVPAGAHPRVGGARFTESVDAIDGDRMTVRGLPVTSPARTIVDLAGRRDVSAARLDTIVVRAHRERRVQVAEVAAAAERLRRRGRRGIGKLDVVFADRAPGDPVPGSELEEQLWAVIGLAGLDRVAEGQYPLPGRELAGLVDAAIPAAKLILEADGRRWHAQQEDMDRDRERDNQASAAGWLTMRFTYKQLVGDPHGSAAQVRKTHGWRVPQGVSGTAH